MNIQKEDRNGVLTIIVEGRIDQGSQDQFEEVVQEAIAAGHRKIILEMSDVIYVNSRFLLVIANAHKDTGNGLVLCGMQPRVERVFKIVGFDKFFSLYLDLAAALAHFQT